MAPPKSPSTVELNTVFGNGHKSNTSGLIVSIDTNQFWTLVAESRLFPSDRIASLRARYANESAADSAGERTTEPCEKWLVSQGFLTEFQAMLLRAGRSGPFRFENYVTSDRLDEGALAGGFVATHVLSQHPVHLDFFSELGVENPQEAWQQIVERVVELSRIEHPAIVNTIESVTLPDHAFVVSDIPSGQTLEKKLPRKGRMNWQAACVIGVRLASAIAELQKRGLVHGSISPRTVWLSGKSTARLRMRWRLDPEFDFVIPETEESKHDYLAPEVCRGEAATSASDLFSLGCLLHRLISGRPVTTGVSVEEKIKAQLFSSPRELSKYDVPVAMQQLLNSMLAKSPGNRPTDASSVVRMLTEFTGQTAEQNLGKSDPPATLIALRRSLEDETPVVVASKIHEVAPETVSVLALPESTRQPISANAPLTADAMRVHRRSRKRQAVLAFLAALTLFGVTIGLVAMQLAAGRVAVGEMELNFNGKKETEPPLKEHGVEGKSENDKNRTSVATGIIQQQIVEDDGQGLWQSPTNGRKMLFSYLPPAPKIILLVRPSALVADEQGELLLRACGAELKSLIEEWTSRVGFKLEEIETLVVGFYPNELLRYDTVCIVQPKESSNASELVDRLKANQVEQAPDDPNMYESGDFTFLLIREAPDADQIVRFVVGPKPLVIAAAEMGPVDALAGAMQQMAESTDEQRHLNLLFVPSALFNDEGQWLMSGVWAPVNRRLRVMFDDSIRGGLLSVHFEQGCYLELVIHQAVDTKPVDLQKQIDARIKSARDDVTKSLASIPTNPYWEPVRLRFDNMLADAYRNLRVGVERRQVMANCWLPPMAAHNLIAASELALTFTAEAAPEANLVADFPQTIEQLLKTSRSLKVTTNPDLNVLLQSIATEVTEQYPSLPFKFQIELIGTDLVKEGITQNQRPGDFTAENVPLSKILTEIMVRANPDKSLSGPNDARCKLVWLIADDPKQPGQKIVQVTTRAAATERNLTLPVEFQIRSDEKK